MEEERRENGQESRSVPWPDLPRDVLLHIFHHLPGRIERLRQHSVCSPWRSSSFPTEPRFPPRLLNGSSGRYLSRRTVFLLSPPPCHRSPASDNSHLASRWLVKLEDQASPGKMRVCYPLRGEYVLGPLPSVFPRKIDLLEVGVVELGHEYIFWSYDASFDLAVESIHGDKLAVCYLRNTDDFVVLAIKFSGRLLSLYRSSEDEGVHKRIAYDKTRHFSDLIVFQRMFYVVGSHGMTHVIRPESMEVMQTIASKVELCGETKRLVECGGELLLVDICTKQACCGSDQRIRFRLFKMHRNQMVWVETSSIGDNVVFLGEKSSFSAPALTLGGRGDRILYESVDLEPAMDRADGSRDDVLGCGFIKVFDVGSGCLQDLSAVPELLRLFWPPPTELTIRM